MLWHERRQSATVKISEPWHDLGRGPGRAEGRWSAMTASRGGIVAGYDGSPGSDEALRWAVEEAKMRGCVLTVCQAWAPRYLALLGDAAVYDLARQRGETILACGVRRAEASLGTKSVTSLPVRGPAVAVLRELSTTAEMVVLGARGYGDDDDDGSPNASGPGGCGVRGTGLGSVAWQVAGHARGPVVVVRGKWRLPHHNPGPVVAGADGSASSDSVLRFAFQEARLRDTQLVAVCALADTPASLGAGSCVREDFDRALEVQEKAHPEVPVVPHVSPGSARTALLDAAAGAQLLVVGARGRGGLGGMSLGSVAHIMLYHAPCPVAVLHAA